MKPDTNKILSGHIYDFVNQLMVDIPGNYFEIGVFNGIGIAQLGKRFGDKIIYAVDPFIEDGFTKGASGKNAGEEMISQRDACRSNISGLDNIVLFETTSSDFADTLTDEMVADMNISMVTIDGSHHYQDVTVDYELAMRLFGNNHGVIVFDDMEHAGVRQAYYECITKYMDRIPVVRGEIIIADGVARALFVKGQ